MKKYFLLACAFCVFGVADAATIQFSSPDKKLQVTVADDGGRPTYRVVCGETVFLEQSPLGLLTNIGDFSQGMTLQESSFSSSPVSGHYELPTIKRSVVQFQRLLERCAPRAAWPHGQHDSPPPGDEMDEGNRHPGYQGGLHRERQATDHAALRRHLG